MPPQFNSLPTRTSSTTSSRSSLPIFNARRRLVNKHHSSSPSSSHASPLVQVATPTKSMSTSSSGSDNSDYTSSPAKIPIAPPTTRVTQSLHRSSSPASLITAAKDPLKGVVACLDIRTEDGDDVSQNFEKALKSMGAKALHNNCKIVNLLWITNCKSEGKRLPEDKYLIHQPENLLLSSAKRRKSMEPGRVKALVLGDQSDDNLPKRFKSPNSTRTKPPLGQRRKTVSHWETSAIIPKESTVIDPSALPKSNISLDLDDLDIDFGVTNDTTTVPTSPPIVHLTQRRDANNGRPSLPAAFSRSMRRLSCKDDSITSVSQKPTVNKEIKAGFFIGSPSSPPSTSAPSSSTSHAHSLQTAVSSPPTLVRRQRRSLSHRPTLTTAQPALKTATTTRPTPETPLTTTTTTRPTPQPPLTTTRPFPQPITRPSPPATTAGTSKSSPLIATSSRQTTLDRMFTRKDTLSTIVMTSMDEQIRKKCAMVIQRLGNYRLSSTVDEKTTHVIDTHSLPLSRARLLDSDKANTYLDELSYEAILFFPRARAARRKDPLLPSNVSVYINSTTLPPDLVTSLVSKAGGQVTSSLKEADIILSNTPMNLTAITVTENWLLDSIEHWRYLATDRYTPH
ncbi:hypothetical protein [Absidia glauca]|uniref:BRCT domain-containing protein n=1 Tax=Absidia glauca TaxID=4829 RepID=A0A163K970_ABSGL|nr:hypothetical protein [Absidia glauca]